jgi:hypothetical protein
MVDLPLIRGTFLINMKSPLLFRLGLLLLCPLALHAADPSTPIAKKLRGAPIDSGSNPSSAITLFSTNGTAHLVSRDLKIHGETIPLIGFDRLSSFTFEPGDDLLAPSSDKVKIATEKTEALIPKSIKELDRKKVAIRGFMLPLRVDQGKVQELLIMKDQSMCCFGTVPKINEWIGVKVSGAGVKPVLDEPVTIMGTLHVGELRERNYLVSIYRLDGIEIVSE